MSLGERLSRWWAHRKLSAGRCANCDAVLRDDQRDYCSDACVVDWQARSSW